MSRPFLRFANRLFHGYRIKCLRDSWRKFREKKTRKTKPLALPYGHFSLNSFSWIPKTNPAHSISKIGKLGFRLRRHPAVPCERHVETKVKLGKVISVSVPSSPPVFVCFVLEPVNTERFLLTYILWLFRNPEILYSLYRQYVPQYWNTNVRPGFQSSKQLFWIFSLDAPRLAEYLQWALTFLCQ